VRFKVTEKHIAEGKPQDSSSCAIACMFKEVFNTENVYVEDAYIMSVDVMRVELAINDIKIVDSFINDFDDIGRSNKFIGPIEFEAELVSEEEEAENDRLDYL
jgi:hypothetical protein